MVGKWEKPEIRSVRAWGRGEACSSHAHLASTRLLLQERILLVGKSKACLSLGWGTGCRESSRSFPWGSAE